MSISGKRMITGIETASEVGYGLVEKGDPSTMKLIQTSSSNPFTKQKRYTTIRTDGMILHCFFISTTLNCIVVIMN